MIAIILIITYIWSTFYRDRHYRSTVNIIHFWISLATILIQLFPFLKARILIIKDMIKAGLPRGLRHLCIKILSFRGKDYCMICVDAWMTGHLSIIMLKTTKKFFQNWFYVVNCFIVAIKLKAHVMLLRLLGNIVPS